MKYRLPEKKTHHRARTITTAEGKFMHVGDCKDAINDPDFIVECLAVLKVAVENRRPHLEALQFAIGNAFYELSGEGDKNSAKTTE